MKLADNDNAPPQPLWDKFKGRPNTPEVLREKAGQLAYLITLVWDDPVEIAKGLHKSESSISEEVTKIARLETVIFWRRIVDEFAFRRLPSAERDQFIDAFDDSLIEKLVSTGIKREDYERLTDERLAEYANYRLALEERWTPETGGGTKGTVRWEFAKRVGSLVGFENDIVFVSTIVLLLTKSLARLQLATLLRGEDTGMSHVRIAVHEGRKTSRFVPYVTGFFWIIVSLAMLVIWPEPEGGFMYWIRYIVGGFIFVFGALSLRVAIFASDEEVDRVMSGKAIRL
jgi:hypothetical protein